MANVWAYPKAGQTRGVNSPQHGRRRHWVATLEPIARWFAKTDLVVCLSVIEQLWLSLRYA